MGFRGKEALYVAALLASAMWFTAAFVFFSLQHDTSVQLLVSKPLRSSPLYLTMKAIIRFLGGLNGALALLCWLVFGTSMFGYEHLFDAPAERMILLSACAAGHFSQFIFNVPVLWSGQRNGDAYWPVLSGQMSFIFFMDLSQALFAGIAAIAQVDL